jgi:hypothetical protein
LHQGKYTDCPVDAVVNANEIAEQKIAASLGEFVRRAGRWRHLAFAKKRRV